MGWGRYCYIGVGVDIKIWGGGFTWRSPGPSATSPPYDFSTYSAPPRWPWGEGAG